jgi:hypothetical protein
MQEYQIQIEHSGFVEQLQIFLVLFRVEHHIFLNKAYKLGSFC